ncbi:MAG: hypothetical protein ACOY3I_01750 [Verrucomicrobiota bacterium]
MSDAFNPRGLKPYATKEESGAQKIYFPGASKVFPGFEGFLSELFEENIHGVERLQRVVNYIRETAQEHGYADPYAFCLDAKEPGLSEKYEELVKARKEVIPKKPFPKKDENSLDLSMPLKENGVEKQRVLFCCILEAMGIQEIVPEKYFKEASLEGCQGICLLWHPKESKETDATRMKIFKARFSEGYYKERYKGFEIDPKDEGAIYISSDPKNWLFRTIYGIHEMGHAISNKKAAKAERKYDNCFSAVGEMSGYLWETIAKQRNYWTFLLGKEGDNQPKGKLREVIENYELQDYFPELARPNINGDAIYEHLIGKRYAEYSEDKADLYEFLVEEHPSELKGKLLREGNVKEILEGYFSERGMDKSKMDEFADDFSRGKLEFMAFGGFGGEEHLMGEAIALHVLQNTPSLAEMLAKNNYLGVAKWHMSTMSTRFANINYLNLVKEITKKPFSLDAYKSYYREQYLETQQKGFSAQKSVDTPNHSHDDSRRTGHSR